MIEIQSLQEEVKQLRIFIEEQMEDIKNQILLIIDILDPSRNI